MWRESRKNGTALIRKGETRFHQASRAESKKPGFYENLRLLTRFSAETRFLSLARSLHKDYRVKSLSRIWQISQQTLC
jgi:hypothetical protein